MKVDALNGKLRDLGLSSFSDFCIEEFENDEILQRKFYPLCNELFLKLNAHDKSFDKTERLSMDEVKSRRSHVQTVRIHRQTLISVL